MWEGGERDDMNMAFAGNGWRWHWYPMGERARGGVWGGGRLG